MAIKMRIKGLVVDPISKMPIVVLQDPETERLLPIWIGVFEANAITLKIENIVTPRPMTHDLISNLLTRPYQYITTDPTAPYDILNGFTGLLFVLSLPLVAPMLASLAGIRPASAQTEPPGDARPNPSGLNFGYDSETGRLDFVGGTAETPLLDAAQTAGALSELDAGAQVLAQYANAGLDSYESGSTAWQLGTAGADVPAHEHASLQYDAGAE